MKKILFFALTFSLATTLFAQKPVTKTQRTNLFINTWGLVKYRHPVASKGTYDMNNEFIAEYKRLESVTTDTQLNEELTNWVAKFDNDKPKYKPNNDILGGKYNVTDYTDANWITNSGFTPKLVEILQQINHNINMGAYYGKCGSLSDYPDFKNEKALADFDVTNEAHRLLTLASYWNTIKYWDVNSILTDIKWADVLTQCLPDFESTDKTVFEKGKEKLIAALNDSHANYEYSHTLKSLKKYPHTITKNVNDSLVVVMTFNKTFAEKDNIAPGDVIFFIEGKPVKNYAEERFGQVISASNKNYLNALTAKSGLLTYADKDSVQVGILKKNGTVKNTYLHLYTADKLVKQNPETLFTYRKENYYDINDATGYINLGGITNEELEKAFKTFSTKKGIILDLRNYPSVSESTIANFLLPEKKLILKLLTPYLPGYSKYGAPAPLGIIKDPFSAGKTNKNYYKGTVVLLVDAKTASFGEHIAMTIQQSTGCITIGQQTFGAVMNRKEIILIDGTKADYTFAGTFYPDDTPVQRKGLKIDYSVKESAKNYDPELYIKEGIRLIGKY